MRFKVRNSLQWFLCGFAIAVLALAPLTSASAEKYPSSPITVIIPWPPGGGADTTVRFLSGALEKDLGVPIVVKNIPGAASMTGMAALWRAKPDGYTIGMTYVQHTAANEVFNKDKVPYKTLGFEFIGEYAEVHYMVAVPTNSKYKTIQDLTSSKDKVRFCVPSPNGTEALAALILSKSTGMKLALVSGYKGAAPSILGALKGECDAVNFGAALKKTIDAGDLRPLLVYSMEKSPWFPKVPDVADLKITPDLVSIGSLNFVMWAPPKMPKDKLAIIQNAMMKAAKANEAEIKKRYLTMRLLTGDQTRKVVEQVMTTTEAAKKLIK
jgi:putative tricarboxylic transport membrane protein